MKYKIFMSGVQKELRTERRALKDYIHGDALLGQFFEVFLFEDIPALDRRADHVYLEKVKASDIYIGVFGKEYGNSDKKGKSPTHQEFITATEHGKQRLIFVKGANDIEKAPKMRQLIESVGEQLIRRRFSSQTELTAAVYASLVQYLEKTGNLRAGPFDATAAPHAAIDDISSDKIKWFLSQARNAREYALDETTPVVDVLTHLNLLDNGKPTHAAILLFGNNPQRYLISSEVKCMHFHTLEKRKPIPSYQIYKGTLFDLVDQAVDFVMSKLNRAVGTRVKGPQAPVEYDIPEEVVAEGIVNAVAHRDYTSNASVEVQLFPDRLEIWNPGIVHPPLTLKKLLLPHASQPNNPLIAEPLFLTKYIEKAGSGTVDMINRCRKAGLPRPQFRIDDGFFVLTVWRKKSAGKPELQPESPTKSPDKLTGQVAGQVTGQLAAAVLKLCREPQTAKSIQIIVGIRHRETFLLNYLNPLLDKGWIERTIPDKPQSRLQKYRLTKKGAKYLKKGI